VESCLETILWAWSQPLRPDSTSSLPGPPWDADSPADEQRIGLNAGRLVRSLRRVAHLRTAPSVAQALSWHKRLYAGCTVPVPGYVGHFRGDPTVPELLDYEVGVGAIAADGYFEKMGLPSTAVLPTVEALVNGAAAASAHLDALLPAGVPPTHAVQVRAVVSLAATLHGEWVRIHPFANGNGRTARVWSNWTALRYGLPAFVRVKPRPGDIAYVRAGYLSMGRPPDYAGDHQSTVHLFAHMLSEAVTL
jgi:hypothetical protein